MQLWKTFYWRSEREWTLVNWVLPKYYNYALRKFRIIMVHTCHLRHSIVHRLLPTYIPPEWFLNTIRIPNMQLWKKAVLLLDHYPPQRMYIPPECLQWLFEHYSRNYKHAIVKKSSAIITHHNESTYHLNIYNGFLNTIQGITNMQ